MAIINGKPANAYSLPMAAKIRKGLKPLSKSEKEARRPPPPDIMANAMQERIHKPFGTGRAAKSIKNKRAKIT